jgi:hypothetical protein
MLGRLLVGGGKTTARRDLTEQGGTVMAGPGGAAPA